MILKSNNVRLEHYCIVINRPSKHKQTIQG